MRLVKYRKESVIDRSTDITNNTATITNIEVDSIPIDDRVVDNTMLFELVKKLYLKDGYVIEL